MGCLIRSRGRSRECVYCTSQFFTPSSTHGEINIEVRDILIQDRDSATGLRYIST
jgi:hypothetical protein